jgi:uncharacterized protein YndB with AHSA1/START domain
MKQYMPVTSVVSQWEVHSPIVWTSEFQGKSFEVRGTVLRFEPERVLEYNHSLPIFRPSGVTHPSENYQRVIIELSDEDGQTRLSVTEQGNTTRRQLEHSAGSWRMVLHGMKALLEGTSVLPLRESRER